MLDRRLVKLGDGFYFIKGERKGKFPSSHGFLLLGDETTLIDAGVGKDRIEAIDQKYHIDTLLISHSHPDHIRYHYLLEDRRLMLPRETPDSVKDLQLLGERFAGDPIGGRHWVQFVTSSFGVRALREPDARYGDGDVIRVGSAELLAIHVPGHINDHYCFFEKTSGVLMSTDIDLTSFGPWYGNPESDPELFRAGVEKIMALPRKYVCSSHREPIFGAADKEFRAFVGAFDRHAEMILKLCEKPTSLEALTAQSPFYNNGLSNKIIQNIFEKNMISKNLQILLKKGWVQSKNGQFQKTD